jgi:PAS domain S-box-containing protein
VAGSNCNPRGSLLEIADPHGLHVLLVEDNPDDLWLLGEILRGRGHTVTACEDGESAWAAYQKTHPPLLILDWVLPDLDGLEICRLIREDKGGPDCVILVVTARVTPEDLRLVLEAGADDYIPKPLNVALFEIRLAVAEQRVRNIRERERTRLALDAKTRELEALFQNLDEVFFSVDMRLNELIQVSPGVEELLGVPPEEFMRDRDLWRHLLLPPRLREAGDVARQIPAMGDLTFEYEATRPDGGFRWVKANLKPTIAASGEIVRLDGILSDLTDRRVAEEELSARNRQIEATNQELEIFAYTVSHDLRAPVRTMQGLARSLLEEHGLSIPREAQELLGRIITSGHQSEELIDDLLTYCRMSFEELVLQEVELGEAVLDARDQVRREMEGRRAVLELPATFPTVVGHHTTLVQVLANLLSNAVKFVPESRTPEVRLRWEEMADSDRIRLWVEDNGVGIPPEEAERIFRVFERLEADVNRPGTGIGLALVRRGIQRLGGEAGVTSEVGEGSRFWVQLPKSGPQGWRPWGRRTRL